MYIKYSYGKILCPNHVNLLYFFHMWNMASLSSYCHNILLKMNIRKITRGFGVFICCQVIMKTTPLHTWEYPDCCTYSIENKVMRGV